MQIVFLNTFEKSSGGGIESAQLTIGEENGVWFVHWLQITDFEEGEPEVWFEGTSWEELLAAFRHGAARMMGAGYSPIIDGILQDGRSAGGSFQSMLQCYGELNADEKLFQSLREWRRSAAAAERKSAYLVATNRMLWMISAFVPHTEAELQQLPGWGNGKHAAYGATVLGITAAFTRETTFPLDWVPDQLDAEVYTGWLFKQKELKYKNMMERQQEKKRMLEVLGRGGLLGQLEEEIGISRRELIIRIEQLGQEGYDVESLVERELSDVPEAEQQQIWDALGSVGDRYLRPVLKQVYGEEEAAAQVRPIDQLYERLRLVRIRYRRTRAAKVV